MTTYSNGQYSSSDTPSGIHYPKPTVSGEFSYDPDLDFAIYRHSGEVTLKQAVSSIDWAIGECRRNGIGAVLINVEGLGGFPPPTLTQRFDYIERFARTASGVVVVAIVSVSRYIDPEKIGTVMAANRGMTTDVFTEERDAIEWLNSKIKPLARRS